ncbi:glycosyltransferase [Niameybacter massiliensis]|uniref:glycosyltransferase n=1 Tax=Niameybacter massiliensis TaxID=1658108 RepID=UPI0009E447EF|nr:glycosyltransferase [Niameybacter massiliensis]
MKKILITCWAMEIGGVERSLLGLLNAIDYSQYEVDLFLCRQEGEFIPAIPEEVHLLPELRPYTLFQKSISETLHTQNLWIGIIRILCKVQLKLRQCLGKNVSDSLLTAYCKASLPFLPPISDKQYDIALSFLTPHYFAKYKAQAKQHIAWIHTDYTALNINQKLESKMWGAYDHIAAVSTQCGAAFKKVFPEHEHKVIEIENILSETLVRQEAMTDVIDEMPKEEDTIRLCTVGRFSTAKAFDNAIRLCRLLLDRGCKVKWYAVGYGGDEPMLRTLIEELNVQEDFIILGKRSNPYPYMKACDIYVQPSRYEGKAVAVREAQILGKPVIITNFETASSQLQDGIDGMIVPMALEACADAMQQVIEDNTLRKQLIQAVEDRSYGNENEVEKLYRLIDRPVRVLHGVGKMNCGGAETMLMNLYRHMDREQIQFDFLVHSKGEGYYDKEILELGGRIYYMPSQGSIGPIKYIKQLIHLIKEIGPFDVVHSHLDWQGGFIALAARMAGIKKIVVHAHTSKLMKYGLAYQLMLRIQKLCIAGFATDCWACSKEAAHFLFYSKPCKSRQRIIPNAIDVERYTIAQRDMIRDALGISKETLLIGQVGSLSPFKNQMFTLQMAEQLARGDKDFKVIFVGQGHEAYRENLMSTLVEAGLDEYVEFLGLREDIPNIMAALDVLVLPSKFEGLGIVAIEAQACGTPCLVSTGVPQEIDMGLGLVSFLSLQTPEDWVARLNSIQVKQAIDSAVIYQAITTRNYDIKAVAQSVGSIYCAS